MTEANNPQTQGSGDSLDTYACGIAGAQAAVDIFKGRWSSQFPESLGITAGVTPLFNDPRIEWMIQRLGGIKGWRVLELGPLEGGHSYMLEQAGAEKIEAVDACTLSYLKCLIVKELCKLTRVEFIYGDFMAYLEAQSGLYDLIVASGILYHQSDPITCIEKMAARTNQVFLWTHYYVDGLHSSYLRSDMFTRAASQLKQGFNCDLYHIEYETYLPDLKYRCGVDNHAHWMRREDILDCLQYFGLSKIELAFDQSDHPFGPNFALLATRPTVSSPHPQSGPTYQEEMLAMAGPEPWCIDHVRFNNGYLEVWGWAMPPAGQIENMKFLVNGMPAAQVDKGLLREAVGSFYWFYPEAHRSGFFIRHPLDTSVQSPLLLQYIDASANRVIEPLHDLSVRPQDLRGETPVPPLALIQRAHAGNSIDQYFVEGHSIYRNIEQQFFEATGASICSVGNLLDFGCGPGRLARYFIGKPGLNLVAVDVDPDCVAWCRDHLGGASFRPSPLRPSLPMNPETFDCILAIDVLTHLGKQDGLAWLADWVRLLKPGGIAVVTITSDLAITRAGLSQEHYERIKGYDFLDLSRNPDLDGIISDPDYYKNVFYSHEHLQRTWSLLGLEVLRIRPGCIINHQDLVIMKRC